MKYLYIIRGPFGTGKTEFARTITDTVVSCWDYYAKYGKNHWDEKLKPYSDDYCRSSVKSLMEQGTDKIAVTNSFSKNEDLDYYYQLAEELGYAVFCMIMNNRNNTPYRRDAPEEVLKRQVAQLKNSILLGNGL